MDGAALLAAAVRAACQAKAPRRTVQAVAAAVTGVLVRPIVAAVPRSGAVVPAGAQSAHEEPSDPAILLESLRAARRAQRARKKERRRAAKQAATDASQPPTSTGFSSPGEDHETPQGAAGQRAEPGGSSAAAPAQAPGAPLAVPSPSQPPGAPTESVKSNASGTLRARSLDDRDSSGTLGAARPATSTASHAFAADQSPPRQGGTSPGRNIKARRR